jgi:antitoxin HigA-1
MYQVVNTEGKELKTNVLLHPGEVLEMELEARGIKKSKFALQIQVYPAHLSDIIKGKRNIGEEMALKLENALGISAEFWMRIQIEYNLNVLRGKNKAA